MSMSETVLHSGSPEPHSAIVTPNANVARTPARVTRVMCGAIDRSLRFLKKTEGLLRLARAAATFEPKAGDTFIVTYPRSGTTWLQMILYQLTTDGDMSFDHISQVVPFFERAITRCRNLENLPSPRIFKCHWHYNQMSKWPGRYIYAARDGRDVLLSYYHFSRTQLGFRGSLPEFFDRFMRGAVECGSWVEHVAKWYEHADDSNVLYLRYTELKSDLAGSVKKIARFMGLDVTPERERNVLERCSFEYMKRHESQFDLIHEICWENSWTLGSFLRRGQVGSWKEELSVEQAAVIEGELARRSGSRSWY